MLYANLGSVPQSLLSSAGLYVFAGGCWVTPRNRLIDGAALLPLDRAATTQGDGQTVTLGGAIAGAVAQVGNVVELVVDQLHALTAGAMRTQVNYTHRRIHHGERVVLSVGVKLPAGWSTTGPDLLLLQAKDNEDAHLGETGRNPPIALYLSGSSVRMDVRADPQSLSTGNVAPIAQFSAAMPLDRWVTLSMVFRSDRGRSGFAEMWVDRAKAGEYSGPLGYNDVLGLGPNYALYCYDGLGALTERRAQFKGLMAHDAGTSVAEVCDAFESHPAT